MKARASLMVSISGLGKVVLSVGRDLALRLLDSIDKLPAAHRAAVLVVLLCCISGQKLGWMQIIGALLHQAA